MTMTPEEEIAALVARLRAEARLSGVPDERPPEGEASLQQLITRREAEELWAVSSDRPFLAKPGRWGQIRGALLTPIKFVLKKLMRWYVEPPFSDQRRFNATTLRLVDELHEQTGAAIARIERRVTRLEGEESGSPGPR
jgi:hypothetical protein